MHTRRALECYIESILMYRWDNWTKSRTKKSDMLRTEWTTKKSNKTVLWDRLLGTYPFLAMPWTEWMEHPLTTIWSTKNAAREKKKGETMLGRTEKWLSLGGVTNAPKTKRDQHLWKDMIANAKKNLCVPHNMKLKWYRSQQQFSCFTHSMLTLPLFKCLLSDTLLALVVHDKKGSK